MFLAVTAALPSAAAAPAPEVFRRSPGKGSAVMSFAYYTQPRGVSMMSVEQRWSRSDTIDVAYRRTSNDNGRTWSDPLEYRTGEKRSGGTWRRHPRPGFLDRKTGKLMEFWMEAVLPTDDPLEGLRRYSVYYSAGGGPPQQIIADSGDALHPLPGVELGRNGFMLGDHGSAPIPSPSGDILLPVEIFPARDGKLYNPGGGYTWSDAAVLHGRWRGEHLEWRMSNLITGDPARTTRGMVEPTIAFLDRRRVLMVLRGSNDKNPELPGYKWFSISKDGGRTFPPAQPWTFTGGEPFYSPSSCSLLLSHSNGRLYWLGNITPRNPRGNRPRYPLVIGEVNRSNGLLMQDSLRTVDDRKPSESEILTLSNFHAHEDRETNEILLYVTRLFAHADGWEGDGLRYRIRPTR
jgi:hypothetical protein